jgi:hypothetical protein
MMLGQGQNIPMVHTIDVKELARPAPENLQQRTLTCRRVISVPPNPHEEGERTVSEPAKDPS